MIFSPSPGAAFTTAEKTTAIVEFSGAASNATTPQRRRRRGWYSNRYRTPRWNSDRRMRVRFVRQVYYRNGRRYVRYVRVFR